MLRIKKDVDLKELEKFGLKYDNEITECYEYQKRTKDKVNNITVFCSDNCITSVFDDGYDILYDLIQANLVEKVED